MYRIDTNMPTSPYPSPFLRQNSYTSTARPAMTTEHRYFGRVKTVNTTPASLTIIPDHRTTRADYVLAFGFSNIQLAEFLYSFTLEERRVSYVLRPGRIGEMLVQDVRVIKGVKVKEEAGSADGRREERIRKDSSVSSPEGVVASQHDSVTLEQEARRNARGEFRNRNGGVPSYFAPVKWDEWSAKAGRARRNQAEG